MRRYLVLMLISLLLLVMVDAQSTAMNPLQIVTYYQAMDNRYGGGKSGTNVDKYFFSKEIMKRVEKYYTLSVTVKDAPAKFSFTDFQLNDNSVVRAGTFTGHLYVVFDCYNNASDSGFAAAYFQDQAPNGRPISGYFQLNLEHVNPSPRNALSHYGVFVHEFYHILALNADLYASFRNSQGQAIGRANIISTVSGRQVYKLAGATINFAKAFLSDSSLTYLVMENGGGSGSAGSHWEYDFWPTDFMSPIDTLPSLLTPLSMYLMKDAGWYDVKDDFIEPMIYGRNAGANFQDTATCPGNRTPIPLGFCPTARKGQGMCSPDGMYKGTCDTDSTFNNNGNCPFIMGTMYCTIPSNDIAKLVDSTLDVVGPGARCASVKQSNGALTPTCATTTCSGTTLTYTFNNKATCQCTSGTAGTEIACGSIRIVCPDAASTALICDSLDVNRFGCLNDCSGKGFCLGLTAGKKTCWCKYGWTGSDCSSVNSDEKALTSAGTPTTGSSNLPHVTSAIIGLFLMVLTTFL